MGGPPYLKLLVADFFYPIDGLSIEFFVRGHVAAEGFYEITATGGLPGSEPGAAANAYSVL